MRLSLRLLNGAACGNLLRPAADSPAAKAAQSLPPILYHLFRAPLPYPIGLKLQNSIIDRRLARAGPKKETVTRDIILFLQHTPTYTTGRRDNSPDKDRVNPEEAKVQHVGAEFFITMRGGQVTYHGPGQLVGYPIFDLDHMKISTLCYVNYLQAILAEYARAETSTPGILAPHPDSHVGVFASRTEKLASIGLHLRRRISMHGFAMNVTPEPQKWFDLVVACGLADVRATSVHRLIEQGALGRGVLPPRMPSVEDAARSLMPAFEEVFGRPVLDVQGEQAGQDEEVRELRELCAEAEEQARRENEQSGGWRTEPDLSRRG